MKAFASILALCMHLPALFLFGAGGVDNAGSAPSASTKVDTSRITISFSPSIAVHDSQDTNVKAENYAKGVKVPRQTNTSGHLTQEAEMDGSSDVPDSKSLAAVSGLADISRTVVPATIPGLLEKSTLYYVPASELTRLPYPLDEIDLEQILTGELTHVGKFDLTILIEENGMVADVIAIRETGKSADFTERIMERFRTARFMPGEIDGKAVKSLIQVTVVSEALAEQTH